MDSGWLSILAQAEETGGGGAVAFLATLIYIAFLVVIIAGGWKTFVKAGRPGWAFIVPIYNAVVFLEIAGKPIWWIILMFIPIVNLIVGIIACIAFAEKFGKGTGFGIGLALLGFIFFPILGFGGARYMAGQPQAQPV